MLEKLLGTFPHVIQLLRDDHKLVRSLFEQYQKAKKGEKPRIAQNIIRELTAHATIEERVVYPAFRSVFKAPQMVYQAVEEHHLMHGWLEELNRFRPGPGSATFDAKLMVLRELVKHHVDEEEGHLFPKAEACDNLDWASLYEKVLKIKTHSAAKKKRTPTHPKTSQRAA